MIRNTFKAIGQRRLPLTLSCLILWSLSGCSTIQFVQLEQPGKQKTINRWHHSTLNGTVELSAPLDIKKICGKKAWTTITTEFTPFNAVIVGLISSHTLISPYSAWTNKVQCYKPIPQQQADKDSDDQDS